MWSWFISWSKVMDNSPKSFDEMMIGVSPRKSERRGWKMALSLSYVVPWTIWKARNDAVYKRQKVTPMKLADEIQLSSFTWIRHRAKFLWLD